MRAFLAAALLSVAAMPMAQAQTSPNAAPADVDPARLAAARLLIARIMPPDQVDKMMESITGSSMASLREAFAQDPSMAKMREDNPKAAMAMDRMLERQHRRGLDLVKAGMPGMTEAMARAYARRFTLPQMADLTAFFATPSGQVYLQQAPTVMADPDVSAWMTGLMRQTMEDLPAEMAKLTAELEALDKEDAK
ncbi:MAG: DUF2059 domain-containing protein [Sphingomonadales bacterium]|nr:MAG: DUF2059 domain-containing protein [Sphingomonadales bacterium]